MIRGQAGSAVVEFALVVPVALALLVGIVEVAVVARTEIQIVQAAREGARAAATTPDIAEAVRAVKAAVGESAAARVRVSVSRPATVGEQAKVVVRLRHVVAAPLFGGFGVDLAASATMRVER